MRLATDNYLRTARAAGRATMWLLHLAPPGDESVAQLTQSRQIAGNLEDQPLSAIVAVTQQALDRDPDWERFAPIGMAGIAPVVGHVIPASRVPAQSLRLRRRRGHREGYTGAWRRCLSNVG